VKNRSLALILAALSTLGPFSIDTYFASFPELGNHFRVSEIQVQQTLSFYLIALAGMNLFHGALSDSYGRRRAILVSLGVYSGSALACVAAPSFYWLLFLRVIQGLAAGAGMIVSRAVIRDRFAGSDAQRMMAQVTVVSGLGPVIAPILGGWLHVWFGWRGPFAFLAAFGAVLWCTCWLGLKESLAPNAHQTLHPGHLLRSYAEAICHPAFVLLCLALAFGGGGFLLYVATAPDVVLNILGLSKTQFGWLFLPIVSGLILGAAVSARAAGRVHATRLLKYGFTLMAIGASANLAVNLCGIVRVPWAVLPLSLYTFGFSLLAPVATIQCLDIFPTRKGLASSIQGFFQTLIFALIAGVVARFVYRSGVKHAYGLLIMMCLSWLAYGGYAALTSPANDTVLDSEIASEKPDIPGSGIDQVGKI